MNTIVIGLLLSLLGSHPDTGAPVWTAAEPPKEMTLEQCITQAEIINKDKDNPYIMICMPSTKSVTGI